MQRFQTYFFSVAVLSFVGVSVSSGQTGPRAIPVGAGSYAEHPPAHEDDGRDRDRIADTLAKKLFIDESKDGVAVPTNAWWTDLIVSQYAGRLWAHPLCVTADSQGIEIFNPTEWSEDGRDRVLDSPIGIRGEVTPGEQSTSPAILIADFESANYPEGWLATGEAFGEGTAEGSLDGQSPVDEFAGERFVNSFNGGDPATGSLESPEFKIERDYIHLLVAGGNLPELAHVDLMVGGQAVHSATGNNTSSPTQHTWDVRELKGKTATIEILDDATGGWGHILVDQIVMTDSPEASGAEAGNRFAPTEALAMDWSDWMIRFRMPQTDTQFMDVTLGHGMPSVWLEFSAVSPIVECGSEAAWYGPSGATLSASAEGDAICIERGGRYYGIFAPDGTTFRRTGGEIHVDFGGEAEWLVVSALPTPTAFEKFREKAFAIPRKTTFSWEYDPIKGEVLTKWVIDAEALKGSNRDVIQGWIPHHYRETQQDLPFDDVQYRSALGLMKCAAGSEFEIGYEFNGIPPALPAPTDSSAFDDDRMDYYLKDYAGRVERGEPGKDTYWGGKDLVCMGRNLTMARELKRPEATVFEDALREALTDWFTYTDGETEHYFARYPRWRGIVGFNESYGSGNFNDHHFHYGYFTMASALLGMADPKFIEDYGPMAKLVAKQYANWERDDPEFPFLRTFDVWEGHSWAGGFSSPGGNNQESSSEAMQSWGGLFQLGAEMGDEGMLAAGAMGHAMESAATREYWFDYYGQKDQPEEANFPEEYAHGITGIFFAGGRAFATYFTADPGWIYGIQWLPTSPSLAYLGRDPKFAQRQFDNMWKERGEWIERENEKKTELGESEIQNSVSSMGDALGPVALGFAVQFDPKWALDELATLWDLDDPVAKESKMGGIIYYDANANLVLGRVQWDWHTSIPTSAVYFNPETNVTECVIYNSKPIAQMATVFRKGKPVGEINVPARSLVGAPIEPEVRP